MSLILEALKKSEANRRLGETPDLDTPFAARPRRRSPLPFIAAAIVVAVGAGLWLQRAPTPEKPALAATVQARATSGKTMADRIMAPADSGPPRQISTTPSTGVAAAEQQPANSQILARLAPRPILLKNLAANNATAKPADAAAAPAVELKKLESPAPTAELKAVTVPAPTVGLKKPGPTATVAPVPVVKTAPPLSMAVKAADANNAKNGKNVTAPAPPVPPSSDTQAYYELPFSVRKDLPAIKLSMHVYAPEPALRFIILNDSRMGEGDSQDELALREIRPDGAVFEFHGKRFFYPRDGL